MIRRIFSIPKLTSGPRKEESGLFQHHFPLRCS